MNLQLSQESVCAGYTLEYHEDIPSTNAYALALAKDFSASSVRKEPFCLRHFIVAGEQTAGRGRRGAQWFSPKGNLYLTLLLAGGFNFSQVPYLGFLAGIVLVETLFHFNKTCKLPVAIQLKWPNDLLLNRKKTGGILLETFSNGSDFPFLALGIGVNILHKGVSSRYETSSLSEAGIICTVEDFFEEFSRLWVKHFSSFLMPEGLTKVRENWLRYAAGLGKEINVKIDNKIVNGIFKTIDENFRCVIRTKAGEIIRIQSGDVYFGAVSTAYEKI